MNGEVNLLPLAVVICLWLWAAIFYVAAVALA